MPGLIHIVDDDESFRSTLAGLLRACGYDVALYATAAQFLSEPPNDVQPGCILLDVRIPGLSGPELQARLAEMGSALPIIFLTGYGDIPTSVQAIKAGAEDFLTKPVTKDQLVAAIERAIARHRLSQGQRDHIKTLHDLVATLTPREREVFELVVRGKMNKQIAHELGTTERTIKAHRVKVMEKTQAKNLAALVSIAERLGVLSALPADPAEQPSESR